MAAAVLPVKSLVRCAPLPWRKSRLDVEGSAVDQREASSPVNHVKHDNSS
jgi:hypothetical protein